MDAHDAPLSLKPANQAQPKLSGQETEKLKCEQEDADGVDAQKISGKSGTEGGKSFPQWVAEKRADEAGRTEDKGRRVEAVSLALI